MSGQDLILLFGMEHADTSDSIIDRLAALLSPEGFAAFISHFGGNAVSVPKNRSTASRLFIPLTDTDADLLCREFGGEKFYIPMQKLHADFHIIAATLWMSGLSVSEVAHKTGRSNAWVQICLKRFTQQCPKVGSIKTAHRTPIGELTHHPVFGKISWRNRHAEFRKSLLPCFQRELAAYYPDVASKSNAILAEINADNPPLATSPAPAQKHPSSGLPMIRRALQKV